MKKIIVFFVLLLTISFVSLADNNDFLFRGLKWDASEEEIVNAFGPPAAIMVDIYFVWINERVIDRTQLPSALLREDLKYKGIVRLFGGRDTRKIMSTSSGPCFTSPARYWRNMKRMRGSLR